MYEKNYYRGAKPTFVPTADFLEVTSLCYRFDVNPYIIFAIGKHETGWGTLGAGRTGYHLGVGVPTTGEKLTQFQGLDNQIAWAIPRIYHHLPEPVLKKSFQHLGVLIWRSDNPWGWGTNVWTVFDGLMKTCAPTREVPIGALAPKKTAIPAMSDAWREKWLEPLEEKPPKPVLPAPTIRTVTLATTATKATAELMVAKSTTWKLHMELAGVGIYRVYTTAFETQAEIVKATIERETGYMIYIYYPKAEPTPPTAPAKTVTLATTASKATAELMVAKSTTWTLHMESIGGGEYRVYTTALEALAESIKATIEKETGYRIYIYAVKPIAAPPTTPPLSKAPEVRGTLSEILSSISATFRSILDDIENFLRG